MSAPLKSKWPYLWPLLVLICVNGLLFSEVLSLRLAAGLVLLFGLSGWLWLDAFFGSPRGLLERLTLAAGLSLALTILATMLVVYLPGPLRLIPLLIAINLVIIASLIARRRPKPTKISSAPPLPPRVEPRDEAPSPALKLYLPLILVSLLLLTLTLRLPRLGYAEFHEDEAEALMLGVRLFQGEDYALFLHRKGPAQMLAPLAMWLLSGRITEALARLPFVLSSSLSVVSLFLIGRRWFGWPAGLVAAGLWAINGYAIAFGRMAQYQALIFFLGPLAIYCLYLAWQERQPRLQILAAILLAVCLLAHFDALLLLPAAAYLAWQGIGGMKAEGGKATPEYRSRLTYAVIALLLFLGILATFYVPYLLDPEFKNTAGYLAGSRVGAGLLYNNLSLLQRLDQTYSSHFYLPLAALGIFGLALQQSLTYTPTWRWGLAGLGLLLLATVWLPNTWRVGSLTLAVLPWLLALSLLWLSANPTLKGAWLLFGAPFIGYVFLVDDPRTHLYIIYPGAVLLAGAGWMHIGGWVKRQMGEWANGRIGEWANGRIGQSVAWGPMLLPVIVGGVWVGLIVGYEGVIFLSRESTLSQIQRDWDNSIWETIYDDLPDPREYFGYPKREGWKTIGALRAGGHFPGDFRSVNEDFIIPIWYNYGEPRSCYDTPAHFFGRAAGQKVLPENENYTEVGQVAREAESRLHIFSANAAEPVQPVIYALEDYEAAFDRLATPEQFTRQSEPARPLEVEFGPAIKLMGYTLPATAVTAGETLYLDLYWQALATPAENYRAFVHLTDGQTLWGQQDDEPACRLPTSIWRPGQRSVGQFRLPIKPDTPPGRYPLIIGLYRAGNLERLKITAGDGQPGDDFLWLADIEVVN